MAKALNPTPAVSSRYGAPMGRHTYDKGGAYWGHGRPLWYVEDQDGNGFFFRDISRDAAKHQVMADFPGARFYR